MATRAYAIAIALLLGLVSGEAQAAAKYTAPSLTASACAKATPGALMYHARYGAKFLVALVDAPHGRVIGTFPGTPHGETPVPVKCADLVRL